MNEMIDYMQAFLATKNLSENSKTAYLYDLQQFIKQCEGKPTPSKLALYQIFLQDLKPAAQKRKVSTVNQFLYYLYEQGRVERYYKVKVSQQVLPQPRVVSLEDRSFLWMESKYEDGQRIALLIAYLGLLPSELAVIKQADIDLNFQVLTITKSGQKRVLSIPNQLLSILERKEGIYLFDKDGSPYSRQWFFNRLSEFLEEQGKSEWTAQKLRQQFILSQLQAGKDLAAVAKHLGLKTMISLEKYKHGY
ncbi:MULTISPECIES: site-specific tyrosine recombinase XerD [unclassified Streptococcus]|uniref:site-specific tyrosine recombinase XerD n=1 Tax=unclassified Streptococcus TaxID=2608887 RepID=UPI00142FDE25|nr:MULTISPECIES: site-specific tyrosine recombinase XerD [unclassified Streptococcus]MBF0787492.1 site-specific tyrosine recombinase XerD [Streptococcus sp. 19428wC2_LYSM12]MCQ9212052.1 site-specific tyrosine recombinase XerD [Streptococcus sp. B01]MCQ9213381.1 site-specific tyrosine recombinase XerD [Streptococcus sp. O1]